MKLAVGSSGRRECIVLLNTGGVGLSKSNFGVEAESTIFGAFGLVYCDLGPSATNLVICGVALGLGEGG